MSCMQQGMPERLFIWKIQLKLTFLTFTLSSWSKYTHISSRRAIRGFLCRPGIIFLPSAQYLRAASKWSDSEGQRLPFIDISLNINGQRSSCEMLKTMFLLLSSAAISRLKWLWLSCSPKNKIERLCSTDLAPCWISQICTTSRVFPHLHSVQLK